LTDEQTTKLTREQLYNEIWEISVAGVAKKYNSPYDELLKLCKETDVPIPPSGYWTKLKFGKPVTQIPLPESSIIEITLPNYSISKRIRRASLTEGATEINTPAQDDALDQQPEIEELISSEEDDLPSDSTVTAGRNIYNREKLYKEVWAKPVVEVAIKYGVSDVAIHKICKSLNVPVPPRGYWAKVRAGAKIEKTPLTKTKGVTEIVGARTFDGIKDKVNVNTASAQPLMFLPVSEREKVLLAAQEITMPAETASLHKKIAAYRSIVKEWNKNDRRPEGAQKSFSSYYYNNKPPFLAGVISNETLPRVYRILDALFRQIESLGGSVNDDLSLQVRNEHVTLEIAEAQDEVKHVITRQEAQALIVYEDEKRRNSWASKPQIRKYDYIFNGRLRISIRKGRYFRDNDKINIESRLGDMLIELYEESEIVRIDREAQEEAARKSEEEARLKEERRKRYNKEIERTIALENAALDFETACRIRAYVKAITTFRGQDGLDDETAAWVDWAMKKADWFDPIVARDDELFGEREHEKSMEEKALKKVGHYW
jgi:DNA uptake protein ComE-like DNA-binding protein